MVYMISATGMMRSQRCSFIIRTSALRRFLPKRAADVECKSRFVFPPSATSAKDSAPSAFQPEISPQRTQSLSQRLLERAAPLLAGSLLLFLLRLRPHEQDPVAFRRGRELAGAGGDDGHGGAVFARARGGPGEVWGGGGGGGVLFAWPGPPPKSLP